MGNTLNRSKGKFPSIGRILAVGVTSAILIGTPAAAQDDAGISLSANAALVSDYRFRGVSLSDKDIAIQGGF
ncbi:MAG: hypothetical protein JKY57_04830, partial [Kordiimonadaceae bacterium]|nr:hypothetical protein [Kordiimonadaceae bacterium]